MEDVFVAGLFTVIGAVASGGVQTGLAVRADRRLRRGAVREIRTELVDMTQAMVVLRTGDAEFAAVMQATVLPEPRAYRRHSALAAQGFSEADWEATSEAYTRYEMVRAGLGSDVSTVRAFTADKVLPMAIEECGTAVASLVPLRRRKAQRRGLEAMKKRANEIAQGPSGDAAP